MDEIGNLGRAFVHAPSPLQPLSTLFPELPIRLFVKRDDQLHPLVSGNKWRKLKYNLLEARRQGHTTLLTFGGAYSNHLYATAAAGRLFGFRTVGLVRGDEAQRHESPTLAFCRANGMTLHRVDRATYRRRDDPAYWAELRARFGPCYVVPEGGTNELAVRGTAEIMPELRAQLGNAPDYVACAVGTGGTLAGLVRSAEPDDTRLLGVSVLKGVPLPAVVPPADTLTYLTTYHFGGYAKTTPDLYTFIRDFERRSGILVEQVYTGKLFYALFDLARTGFFPPNATVVALHTGGLQGRSGALDER